MFIILVKIYLNESTQKHKDIYMNVRSTEALLKSLNSYFTSVSANGYMLRFIWVRKEVKRHKLYQLVSTSSDKAFSHQQELHIRKKSKQRHLL